MPFIGQQPLTGAYSKLDAITTSATATYNLLLNGGAYSPASANHLLVSLNGVIQAPQDSFTVSGSTITFASALTSSDNIDFIMAMGDVLNIGTPSDGTVTAGKIATDAVSTAKIASNAVTSTKINANAVTVAKLASTLDLSSNTVTLNKNASGLVHLATIDASPATSNYEFSMDYDDYNNFMIFVEQITGSSSAGSENLDVKFKMDGVLDSGESTPYYTTNVVEYGTVRNLNSADNMEFMTTNQPFKIISGIVHCVNFNNNSRFPQMHFKLGGESTSNTGYGDFTGSAGIDVINEQVTAIRFAFTAGNVATVKLKIYGMKD